MDMAQLKKEYNIAVYTLGKLELQLIDNNNLKKNLIEEITSIVKNIKKLEREEETKKAMESASPEPSAKDDKKDTN